MTEMMWMDCWEAQAAEVLPLGHLHIQVAITSFLLF